MKTITFATGNQRKMREAIQDCQPRDIRVIQAELDIDEVQSHDPMRVAQHKVDKAYEAVQSAVVINDAFWNIPALNGFPGGYMKDVQEWFAPEDFIQLLDRHSSREIILTETIFYRDMAQTKHFTKEFVGRIVQEPRGELGNSLEKVVTFDGHKTIAEYRDANRLAFEADEYIWRDFAIWYVSEPAGTDD